MPKSKIRGRSKLAHYSTIKGVLSQKQKQLRYGKKAKPVPGATHRIQKKSPYMGSIVTSENRNEYEIKQAEAFKERYVADVKRQREEISNQEDKTEDEIRFEIEQFNKEQISEEELESMAKRFARFQTNKEQKHYKTWLSGGSFFRYKGRTFPVITEKFLKQTKSIKDIVKVDENEIEDK